MRLCKLICTSEVDGFTIGKSYQVLGFAGEYVALVDDNGEECTLYEGHFKIDE